MRITSDRLLPVVDSQVITQVSLDHTSWNAFELLISEVAYLVFVLKRTNEKYVCPLKGPSLSN